MILQQVSSKVLLLSSLRRVYIPRRYCKDKKDPPAGTIVFPNDTSQNTTKETVTIAPKVIAKHPPIEELTHGRVFDPATGTYKVATVPRQTAPLSAKEVKPPTLPDTEIIRNQLIQALTSIPPKKDKEAKSKKDDSGTTQPPADGGTGGQPAATIPRLTRSEPGKVFFCIIPTTWVKAFNHKTGITGFWTFLFTYSTYLLSKEKLVMEHEYYNSLSMALVLVLSVIYAGPSIAQSLDKHIDAYENSFRQLRIDENNMLEEDIQHEEKLQLSMEEQLALVAAKRENVHLQLEAEFRERQMVAYKKVKDLLDFQVAHERIERKFAQEQMVRWTLQKVRESITDEIDSQYIDGCLIQLDTLSQQKQAI